MNEVNKIFEIWKKSAVADSDLMAELQSIENNSEEINDRFYRHLEFGTAGIRGIIGAGTNRINIYVVGRLTQAFSIYLNSVKFDNEVAISYDSRIKSKLFAKTAAQVLAANGIKVKIFRELMPVPVLAYAVRYYKCAGGIMITASHNSADYNGYKIYDGNGCQILEDTVKKIDAVLQTIDMFSGVKSIAFEDGVKQGLISFCDCNLEESFFESVESSLIQPEILANGGLKLVYTPLNGSGMKPVWNVMCRLKMNLNDVYVVEQQKDPDGTFFTCKNPNPELLEAFSLALNYCQKFHPDAAIATDPDCDRVGVVTLKPDGSYVLLNGNQIGVLMFNYICSQRTKLGKMPKNAVMIKTIVSTPMAEKIADHYGVTTKLVLTGFKYIGQKIIELEQKSEQSRFIFAFEESHGYLAGTYVLDKDGVFAAMLICEMIVFYKKNGKTLFEVLNNLYEKFGHFKSSVKSYVFSGEEGFKLMEKIMEKFRILPIEQIGNFKIVKKTDYFNLTSVDLQTGVKTKVSLPQSNVVEFDFENNLKAIIRVSGTESKLKIYYHTLGESQSHAFEIEQKLHEGFVNLIDEFKLN